MKFPYLSCPVVPPDLPQQLWRDLSAQECPAPADGLPERLPRRQWQQMLVLLGRNGLPRGCACSQPPHRQFHCNGGQQPPRSLSFRDLQMLERISSLCCWDENWWRWSVGPWNWHTFPGTRDTSFPLRCLHAHPLMDSTKGTSQKEPSRAARITQEWASRSKYVMISKGTLCSSACLPFAAYKKVFRNQMLALNRSKSS